MVGKDPILMFWAGLFYLTSVLVCLLLAVVLGGLWELWKGD